MIPIGKIGPDTVSLYMDAADQASLSRLKKLEYQAMSREDRKIYSALRHAERMENRARYIKSDQYQALRREELIKKERIDLNSEMVVMVFKVAGVLLFIFLLAFYFANKDSPDSSARDYYECLNLASDSRQRGYCVDRFGYSAYRTCQDLVKQNIKDKTRLESNLKRCEDFLNGN